MGTRMQPERVLTEYESSGYLSRKTLGEELSEVCRLRPGARAVVATDATLTYEQLDRAITGYARNFLAKGLAKGDQVLLQLPNSAAYVVTLFALMRIGVVPTLLLPSHRRSEVVSLAHELHPVAYIGGRDQLGFDCVEMVEQMDPGSLGIGLIYADSGPERDGDVPRHRLPGLQVGEPSDCPNAVDGATSVDPPHYRDVALNLLSGGTTNNPKIIPRVHEAYAYNAKAAARRCGVDSDSVYMAVLSTSHDFPLANPGILGTLLHGGTVVMCHTAAFDEAFAAIEANAVTMTAIVPAIAEVWNEAWDWYPADTSSLRQILVGAARFEEALGREIISKTGVTIQQGYGLGEGITTFTSLDDPLPVALRTQGKPISSGDELRIVDPQGRGPPGGAPGARTGSQPPHCAAGPPIRATSPRRSSRSSPTSVTSPYRNRSPDPCSWAPPVFPTTPSRPPSPTAPEYGPSRGRAPARTSGCSAPQSTGPASQDGSDCPSPWPRTSPRSRPRPPSPPTIQALRHQAGGGARGCGAGWPWSASESSSSSSRSSSSG